MINGTELIPYFQPIVSMSKKEIFGFEVLARGIDKQGNLVMPQQLFQGLDKETELHIDRTVREKAFEKYSKESMTGHLFVNFLPDYFLRIQEIQKDSHLLGICNKYGIEPEKVVIEITEKASQRFPEIATILKQYIRMGFHVAIDDWGAESSNFDRLALLMPSIVKIDAQLLWQGVANSSNAEIFYLAASMAMKLGIVVIAEGVELIEHFHLSLDAGCPFVQGFLFGKPDSSFSEKVKYYNFINEAFTNYRRGKIHHIINEKNRIKFFLDIIRKELQEDFSSAIVYGNLLNHIKNLMTQHKDIVKSYILDRSGIQISPNLLQNGQGIIEDERIVNRDWSWRPYYIRSLVNQNLFQSQHTVVGPYIDHENGNSVFTICIILGDFLICLDINNKKQMSD